MLEHLLSTCVHSISSGIDNRLRSVSDSLGGRRRWWLVPTVAAVAATATTAATTATNVPATAANARCKVPAAGERHDALCWRVDHDEGLTATAEIDYGDGD